MRAEIAVEAQTPDHWPADVRAEFAKATPLWQQFMVARMNGMVRGYTKRSMALAAERRDVDEYRNRLRGYADRLAKIRGERVEIKPLVEGLLEFLIAVEGAPPQQRPAVILDFAGRVYGLTGEAFAETIMAARQADAPDRQAAEQAAEQAINEEIVAFAGAVDAGGQPLRPYFDEVTDQMRDLAAIDKARGLQPSLGELYSKAIRLNPDVNAKINEAERRRVATQRDLDDRERIAKARAANSSISGAGGGSANPAGGSVAEIVDRLTPEAGW